LRLRVPPAIFFDTDDTLVNTRAASWKLFAQTNSKHGPGAHTRLASSAIFEESFLESLTRRCSSASRPAFQTRFRATAARPTARTRRAGTSAAHGRGRTGDLGAAPRDPEAGVKAQQRGGRSGAERVATRRPRDHSP